MESSIILRENKKYEESLEALVDERMHELEISKEQLAIMASKDYLTKLYNRRYFNDVFQTLFNLGQRKKDGLSLLMIDIDRFKIVNDTYGHLVGDTVLKELASALLKTTRSSDMVVRFGGEEFVLLLLHTHIKGAV